jgi:predicted amidohydrolase
VRESLTVGLAQWSPRPRETARNLSTALALVDRLAAEGCELAVLPELWPCGYAPRTLADDIRAAAEPIDGSRSRALAERAREQALWLVAGSVPELADGALFNTALLFAPSGELVGFHRKAHLYPTVGEHRAVSAGQRVTVCEVDGIGTLGLIVCFDGDFPEVARTLHDRGARVVVEVCAYELAAATWWDRIYPAQALTNGQWWIMANQFGYNGAVTYLGGSQVISPSGEVIATAPRARGGERTTAETLVVTIPLKEEIERADREAGVLWNERRSELYTSGEDPGSATEALALDASAPGS